MKLKFDASQSYQIDAINSVVDIFDGQPLNKGDFEIRFESQWGDLLESQVMTELGIGNNFAIDKAALLFNIQRVQERNQLDVSDQLIPTSGPDGIPLNFSVEMETGTGKTYVYLRTILELNRKYGLKKFIIVVPSVAIREGVWKNLEITKDHFKPLYNNVEYDSFVYDARKINRLRHFAVSNQIQILVINIDAFRKNFTGTDEENKGNVIYKESDKLSGRQPIEFIRATNPIVIIDEPQSVDNTEKAQEAIRALNPLCTLRYSATHRNPYNLVYRLDPIRAYSLRLVKQIVVASVTGAQAFNDGYVRLKSVDYGEGKRPTAKITIHSKTKNGVKPKDFKVKGEEDLFALSNERESYKNGFQISEINAEPGNEYIQFNSGKILPLGQEMGGIRDDVWKVQIKNTIRKHLEKEIQVKGKGIKVLSLFFIDRVANYRSYNDDGLPIKGKFAEAFEEAFKELSVQERYKGLLPHPVEKLHDGYFAQDKKGIFKESREGRSTAADESVYELIMKRKEELLSIDVPLQFIFSHSALREGWDNPNVFQICTLNESQSSIKKRQEIGRGLRLPVNQDGERVFDENINKLLVVANESYEDFARSLQTEYEEDCGVTFGKVPKLAFSQIAIIDAGVEKQLGREGSEQIWAAITNQGFIDQAGKITSKFKPSDPNFTLTLPPNLADKKSDIIEIMKSYQIERQIKRDEEGRRLLINKQVFLDPDFEQLWDKIKLKTTYSVRFSTDILVERTVTAIKGMEKILPVKVVYAEALLGVEKRAVTATSLRQSISQVKYSGSVPDIIGYLQNETELTRSTLVRILKSSDRLDEFLINPQQFMDSVAGLIKRELNKLIIDGIKYEKLSDDEWNMQMFESEEVISYLHNRLDVNKGVYDAVVYDSEIEREFADKMNQREDIKLFVKLPKWFVISTPVGTYNPDWAILKHDGTVLYMVRETKGTKDFERLRNIEAEKIKCGRKHFEELGVDFDVVVSASEI